MGAYLGTLQSLNCMEHANIDCESPCFTACPLLASALSPSSCR